MSDAPTPTAESAEAAAPAPRLLLVDDEPGLRTAVQAYLEDEGFEVTTAVDGEEGFAKAQQMLPAGGISPVRTPEGCHRLHHLSRTGGGGLEIKGES